MSVSEISSKGLQFSIFVIYQLAQAWGKSPAEVYNILNQTEVLDGYLIQCYDCLHTLGSQYLIEDISDLVREKGAAL